MDFVRTTMHDVDYILVSARYTLDIPISGGVVPKYCDQRPFAWQCIAQMKNKTVYYF